MLKLKEGVRAGGIRPETLLGIQVAASIYASHSIDCIVTSITDGVHSATSLHYAGAAFDLRIRHITATGLTARIRKEMQDALGTDYDVILESDHIHCEYQPRHASNN